jgi:protease PrsW
MTEPQLRAIEESGWGLPFRFWQPHNLSFWVYVLGVAAGGVTVLRYFGPAADFYGPALAAGVILFGLYLVPWLLFLRRQNRYTAQPGDLLLTGFLWGGVAATFWIALPANTAFLEIWTKLGGTGFAADWGAGLSAPIDEEWSKALGLVLIIGLAPRLVRSAYDGFIIGAYIGLGFQVFEDVLYAFNSAAQTFGVDQVGSAVQIFFVRGLAGIVSHALFSAIFGAGLLWVLGRTPGDRRVVLGVLSMLLAMFFHFAWDDIGALTGGGLSSLLLLALIEIIALLVIRRLASARERVWIRDLLQPEADAGVISPDLLAAVSGLRRQRRAYRRRLHSRRRARHTIEAASDLAQEIARSGGADTPAVDHARSELLRLSRT